MSNQNIRANIAAAIKAEPGINIIDITEALDIDQKKISTHLADMVRDGELQAERRQDVIGTWRVAYWPAASEMQTEDKPTIQNVEQASSPSPSSPKNPQKKTAKRAAPVQQQAIPTLDYPTLETPSNADIFIAANGVHIYQHKDGAMTLAANNQRMQMDAKQARTLRTFINLMGDQACRIIYS